MVEMDCAWPDEPTVGYLVVILQLMGVRIEDSPEGRFALIRDIKRDIKTHLKHQKSRGRKFHVISKYPESPEGLPDTNM